MGSTMHPCSRVELDFLETAPSRYSNSVELAITPEQLFQVLADAEAWPRWAKVITKVTWTTPLPREVGSTRTVHMWGGLVGDEEFLVWEPYRRMAFRFNEASEKSIVAFAEDYVVTPTARGCRLTWTLALEVRGPARFTLAPTRPLLGLTFRWFLRNLRSYTDRRFAVH
ncbi:SRPBCC family protein [Nocardioides sp. Kera G14]|uniref:SRPBCC family protein n=1 Tax=Nocardioides sp. Kera G14 TaxID=2884264 RepID=UPI001D0F957D|nr:SRPBCC family protein [Nocardioides sp. Kera G14]UDY25010.1 SRPBCC family protein [Nocardioides sp. Kera G14]